MLLSFPTMHPELSSAGPDDMFFFDPGLNVEPVDKGFRPEGLPLDPRTARALINDCLSFGAQFKDPGEMAYFGAVTADDFYEGSSMSIRNQLLRAFEDGQGGKAEREKREAACQAQFILLLAWFFEENMMELNGIEQGVKDAWKNMDVTLGKDDEDRLEAGVEDIGTTVSHTGGKSDGQRVALPWQRIIEALPAFVPEGTILLCTDAEILDAWDDIGIEFASADPAMGLPQSAKVATCPAWTFAGRRKAPEKLPWALSDVTVAVIR